VSPSLMEKGLRETSPHQARKNRDCTDWVEKGITPMYTSDKKREKAKEKRPVTWLSRRPILPREQRKDEQGGATSYSKNFGERDERRTLRTAQKKKKTPSGQLKKEGGWSW